MILLALAIGAVLIVAAIRNSQDALFAALAADVPPFVVWGVALFAVGAVGFIPGLRPVSRGLLALVLVVIVVNNWTAIQAGFVAASQDTSKAATDQSAGVKAGTAAGTALGGMFSGGAAGATTGKTAGDLFQTLGVNLDPAQLLEGV